jgi:hypothetical protein
MSAAASAVTILQFNLGQTEKRERERVEGRKEGKQFKWI